MDSPASADGSRLPVTAALSELRTLAAMLAAEARQHAQAEHGSAAAITADGTATPARVNPQSANATPSKSAKKKTGSSSSAVTAAAASSSIVPPAAVLSSSLRPFHAQMIEFIAPFLDATSLPQLAEDMSSAASGPSAATGTADASDPMSPLYAQIDARRWALKCVVHLAGHTSAPASATMVLGTSNAPPSLPSPAFVMLFPRLVNCLDFFLRGSLGPTEPKPQNWMGLMSNALAALAGMVEDVVRAMAVSPSSSASTADGWITAEQNTELNNSLVMLLGLLHKTMAWGTNMSVSVAATGQLAQTVQAAIKPTPAAAPVAVTSSSARSPSSSGVPPPSAPIAIPVPAAALQRSGSKDALTPRSVIARPSLSPPALSPNDPSGAAGARFISNTGSLFSPASSFALLSNEHWMQLQNQYTANAAALAAAAAASSSIDPRVHDPHGSSGWASSANDSENEVDHHPHHPSHAPHGAHGSGIGAALKYESRVRGARPTRPSAVNAALASGKHSRSTSSASLTGAAAAAAASASAADSAAARRQAHALSAEKVRTHSLHCLLSLSRGAPRLFQANYWAAFVPQDSASALAARPQGGPSLVSMLLLDPATRVRGLAAQALGALLVDSPLTKWSGAMSSEAGSSAAAAAAPRIRKQSGAGAGGAASGSAASKEHQKGAAFTSLSVRMADTLRALHIGLLEALKRETNPSVVQHVLKTLAVLVANTPYQTLSHSGGKAASAGSSATAASGEGGVLVPIVVHLLTHMLHEPSSYHTVSTSHASAAAVAAAAAALMPSTPSRFPSTTRGMASPAPALPSIPSSTAGSAALQASKSDLRHAIFSTLGAIFDASLTTLPEMRILLLPASASSAPSAAGFHLDIVPLLIAHARSRQKADPTPDAYSLLAKLARLHPASLAPWWKWTGSSGSTGGAASTAVMGASLSALIKDCLTGATDVPTKLLALKILEEWTKGSSGSSSSSTEDGDSAGGDDDEKEGGNYEPLLPAGTEGFFNLPGGREMVAEQLVQLYTSLLPPPAPATGAPTLTPQELHQSKQAATVAASVRARILMCLSLIPFGCWVQLVPQQRQTLRAIAMDAAVDSVNVVKTNACRALCLYSLYASREVRREELLAAADAAASSSSSAAAAASPLAFVRRSVELLLSLVDPASSPVVAVRLKAAWALANVADFGGASASGESGASSAQALALHELLPSPLYNRVVSTLLQSTSDNEKILSNVVRGVGNLARWFPLSAAGAGADSSAAAAASLESTATFLRMLSSLLSALGSSKSAKSKWNCCHALGNLFCNASLPVLWAGNQSAANQARRAWQIVSEVLRDLPAGSSVSASPSSAAKTAPASAAPASSAHQHSNFKVRISAASALGAPPSLAHYGHLSSFTLVVGTLLDLARSLLSSAEDKAAGASEGTFKDFKYLAALRLQILQTVCTVLGRYDGGSSGSGGGSDSAAETAELLALYKSHASFLPKLILAERLRWEKESKLIARVERAAAQQAAAASASASALKSKKPSSSLAKPSPALVAAPPSAAGAMSKAAVEQAQAIVEKAASSIESVFRVIESQDPAAAAARLAARFAAEANGETLAMSGSDGSGAGMGIDPSSPLSQQQRTPLISPPRMQH